MARVHNRYVGLWMPELEYDRLCELSFDADRTVSAEVRRAIREYLDRQDHAAAATPDKAAA